MYYDHQHQNIGASQISEVSVENEVSSGACHYKYCEAEVYWKVFRWKYKVTLVVLTPFYSKTIHDLFYHVIFINIKYQVNISVAHQKKIYKYSQSIA